MSLFDPLNNASFECLPLVGEAANRALKRAAVVQGCGPTRSNDSVGQIPDVGWIVRHEKNTIHESNDPNPQDQGAIP